jgi:hypothetical protein
MNVLGFGRTARFVELDAARVAKLFNDGFPVDVVKREYENSRAIHIRFSRMPSALELTELEGKNAIVYQRIDGKLLARHLGENPLRIAEILKNFTDLHESINGIRVPELARGSEFLEAGVKGSSLLTREEKDLACSFIRATAADYVCHGDFHPENVMVDGEGNLWVIDWLTAFRGNPLFDIARTYYLLKYGVSPQDKRAVDRCIEGLFRLLYPQRYVRRRLRRNGEKELFPAFFFIVLVLRLNDNIPEENAAVEKMIAKLKRRALRIFADRAVKDPI